MRRLKKNSAKDVLLATIGDKVASHKRILVALEDAVKKISRGEKIKRMGMLKGKLVNRYNKSVVGVRKDEIETGYFASGMRSTKVHLAVKGKPLCGCKVGKDMSFQWCAKGCNMEFLECGKCKAIALKLKKGDK